MAEDQHPAVLDGLGQGKQVRAIAAELGVRPRAIWDWLHHSSDGQAKRARDEHIAAGLNLGLERLEGAENGLELSKAREIVSYFKWLAETLVRDKYGREPQVQVTVLSYDQAQVRIKQLEQELGIG